MGPLFPILLGAAALSLMAAQPAASGPPEGWPEGTVVSSADPLPWDAPEHRDFFELQRWLARLAEEGRVRPDQATLFDTEASWSRLSATERAEKVRAGKIMARALQDGGLGPAGGVSVEAVAADRSALVKLLGARVELDPRMSVLQQVSQQVRSPDDFKRFVEGSQTLPTNLASRPAAASGPVSSSSGQQAATGPALQKPVRTSSSRVAAPSLPYQRPFSPGQEDAGPDKSFFVIAFGVAGFAAALGFGVISRRFSWGGEAGASPAAPPAPRPGMRLVAARPSAKMGEASPARQVFRATPQSGGAPAAGSSPLTGPGGLPAIASQRQGGRVPGDGDHEASPGDWDPPPIPPPASWPAEGMRPAAWWAITKEEQALLDQWSASLERAEGGATFEEWASLHPELSAGVDLDQLKDKLCRESS
ncbi:MAG: hypothetical protein WC943_15680 [Elusimicrobiota bacterium]